MSDNVFRLRTLDTEVPSKYLLSVFFPGPFQMGKNVFLVDRLETEAVGNLQMVRGVRNDGDVVVNFPDSFQYLLVNRDQYEVISMEEAKKQLEKDLKEEEDAPADTDPAIERHLKAAYK